MIFSSDDDINEAIISEKQTITINMAIQSDQQICPSLLVRHLQKMTNMYVRNEYKDDMVRNI